LEVPCSSHLATTDLEVELFVHILHNCVEYVQGEGDPDPREAAAAAYVYDGDGMANESNPVRGPNWTERVTAPFKFGGREMIPSLAKLGSAMAVAVLGRRTAERLGSQLVTQHLRYHAAATAATAGSSGMGHWQRRAALKAAQRSLTTATARYSAVRGALTLLGPIMWGWLLLDLAKAALGTDYARVIRAVFVLAQVRLVATQGFSNPGKDAEEPLEEPWEFTVL